MNNCATCIFLNILALSDFFSIFLKSSGPKSHIFFFGGGWRKGIMLCGTQLNPAANFANRPTLEISVHVYVVGRVEKQCWTYRQFPMQGLTGWGPAKCFVTGLKGLNFILFVPGALVEKMLWWLFFVTIEKTGPFKGKFTHRNKGFFKTFIFS